jgi:FTR1 family protein
MVRELLEGCMFCVSHIGSVIKNEYFTREEKKDHLRVLIPSILSGVSLGLLISIAIGISLVYAVGDSNNTQFGVSVGEGVSKLIGALFVTDLMFKIPKWFKISNYKKEKKKPVPSESLDKRDSSSEASEEDALTGRWGLGFSLFWNVLRESLEGGTLTAIAVILSDQTQHALGLSVLVALAATFILALIFSLGAKYVSATFFGILAAFLAQLLAMGLWTGMAREFAEVSAIKNGQDPESGGATVIYNYEGTDLGDSLTILEFIGFSSTLTSLTLAIWLLSLVVLSFAQFWHNYLGKPLFPKATLKRWFNTAKDAIRSRCKKEKVVNETIPPQKPSTLTIT